MKLSFNYNFGWAEVDRPASASSEKPLPPKGEV